MLRAHSRLIGILRRFRDDGIHRRHSGGIDGRVIRRRSILIARAVFHRSVFATLLGAFRADVVCRADSERRNASRHKCHLSFVSVVVCVYYRTRAFKWREKESLDPYGWREKESLDPYRWSERGLFLLEEEVFIVFLTLRFLRFYWSAAQKSREIIDF